MPYPKPFRIESMTHSMVVSLLVTNLEVKCTGRGASAAQVAKPKSGAERVKQEGGASAWGAHLIMNMQRAHDRPIP